MPITLPSQDQNCLNQWLTVYGTEKQTLVPIIGNTFTNLFMQGTATEAMGLHNLFVDNPAAIGGGW